LLRSRAPDSLFFDHWDNYQEQNCGKGKKKEKEMFWSVAYMFFGAK
jgi:hypothetical protein